MLLSPEKSETCLISIPRSEQATAFDYMQWLNRNAVASVLFPDVHVDGGQAVQNA